MLRHKFINERTINFDDKVYNDLERLADVQGRTREELIHIAAIDLLKENKGYFEEYILVDYLDSFFSGDVETDACDIAGVKVDLGYNDEDNYTLHFEVADTDGTILEQGDEVYTDIDEMEQFLRQLSYKTIRGHEDIEKYLEGCVDYR